MYEEETRDPETPAAARRKTGKNTEVGPDGNGEQHIQVPIGAVVSDHEACSDVGRDILDRQGTAVDAAIATLICNGVRMFMAIYDRTARDAYTVDDREVTPGDITEAI
ncbi:GGT1-like protein [Mya arenaria]|uniref:GGT1-like protein n=1 Tax=Mya arenaria TaxID=6604 RepID=A0ABY7E1K3_MYAAR|nr:GGT1-like protein [Mya arenaria]